MPRERRARELRAVNTIDVTPLVDLTFLLLIVFMITAPVLEHAVDVSPPSLDAAELEPEPEHRLIELDAAGQVYYAGEALSRTALAGRLASDREQLRQLQVFVRADESRAYGEVMGLMRLARRAGLADVHLVTGSEED